MVRFNVRHAAAAAVCTAGLVGGSVAMAGPASASSQVQDYSCGFYGTVAAEFDYTTPVLTVQVDASAIRPVVASGGSIELGYTPPLTFPVGADGVVSISDPNVPTDPGVPPWISFTGTDPQNPGQPLTVLCPAA